MNDIASTIDWSRAQFALTAIYHWLFVPLTLGLGLIVAVMETVYVHKLYDSRATDADKAHWLDQTRYWMRLFGVNFAIGVATGIILEFEFGTNWSNYSWFVGDIFGAPLAIEGIFAFFCESTFFAVMFFGWDKFSPRQHCAATWLTAFGATLSAWWILVANSWMQYPTGMQFDPEQMRNVMVSFSQVAFSTTAITKFSHTVTSAWTLGGAFVIAVSSWYLLKGRHTRFATSSIKIGSIVGLVGILLTMWSGDKSAVDVTKTQPMKLAAMEGLYEGQEGTPLVALGIVNTDKKWDDDQSPMHFALSIPQGLSILGRHDPNAFIPGIKDIIQGRDIIDGKPVNTVSYAERIQRGRKAHKALYTYNKAKRDKDQSTATQARQELEQHFKYFGYGYLNQVEDAIPNVGLTFYTFHIMVTIGGWLLLFLPLTIYISYRKPQWLTVKIARIRVFPVLALLTLPLTYICSQCGWIVAEAGRQPWVIQDILPCRAAISSISVSEVQTTFFIFLALFTCLLIAEVGIMVKQIKKY